jgi:hypothetical protein
MARKASQYHRGEMDIHEQVETFHLVMNITKWGSLSIASTVLFLTLWFCAGAGFWPALITAAIVVALGITFLRSRPESSH